MAKTIKTFTMLSDEAGYVWASAEMTEARANLLIRAYGKQGITLKAHGTASQLQAQADAINSALDAQPTGRALREMGKISVIVC